MQMGSFLKKKFKPSYHILKVAFWLLELNVFTMSDNKKLNSKRLLRI